MEWIAIEDQMPKTQQTVLAAYTTHLGKQAVTIGWYTPAKTLESGNFESEIDDEYDEATDAYYMKEQWVDESVESEYHYPISGVTHWMPLPDFPSNALAQADAACGVSPGAMGSAALVEKGD